MALLEPGWLWRQLDKAADDVKRWPESLKKAAGLWEQSTVPRAAKDDDKVEASPPARVVE
jgi:hypothetical protein